MKYLILLLLLSCGNNHRKQFFKVVEQQPIGTPITDTRNKKSFHIEFIEDSLTVNYPLSTTRFTNQTRLEMIEELLSLKGDKRIVSYPVMNWNPLLSQIYSDSLKQYSIQVEALFLINQIYLKKPFLYSPLPVITNNHTKREESIDGENIKIAYEKYKVWYERVKEIGLDSAAKSNLIPLDQNDDVKWLYGQ